MKITYPQAEYGQILRGSEKAVEGERWTYNSQVIQEAEAYYTFNPPIYGKTGATRACWIVSERGRRWLVMDGDREAVKEEIESIRPSITPPEPDESSSSSSEDEVQLKKSKRRVQQQQKFTLIVPKTRRRIGIQKR